MTDPLFAQPTCGVVRVALPVPIDSLFDYSLPADLDGRVLPGCRVLVPFSGRRLTGLVVERFDSAPPDGRGGEEHNRAAPGSAARMAVEQLIDPEPVFTPGFMRLLMDAAEEVLCPVGLALGTALPSGSAPKVVREFALSPRGREALRSGAVRGPARAVLDVLATGPVGAAKIGRRVPRAAALLEALVSDGLVRRGNRLQGPSARVARERHAAPRDGIDVDAVCAMELARAPKQAALLLRLAELGSIATSELTHQTGASPSVLRALVDRGHVTIESREVPRNVLGPAVARDQPLPLTDEQAAALVPIQRSIRARRADCYLLHGVTGSGKTEVYLRAISEAMAQGRQALILVPEITLTHQIISRLRARFGDGLAILHSGLRPGERLEQWLRLRAGDTPIAVGARSALFAPLENLGAIIIDEEHDTAYKNEEGFRYHARRLAERRAQLSGCPLILGSATPALETRHRADRGEIERLVLQRRIGGRPLPSVEIIDLAEERRKATRGRKLILSRPLKRAIQQTLDEQGQSILFLNRRGFSTQIFCFDCGHAERCKSCEVSLVYHAAEHCLACHYCEFKKPPPERCGGCGNPDTALLGAGTERLEEEVRSIFTSARTARLDRDTAGRRGHVEEVLAGLRDNEIDILIGTQMVAKGHDFPGVRLVGIIAADVGLHMPDFRAAERTFQLLTQVAGRAGRAARPGRVVLQTFVPDHYAIAPVRKHDYEAFYHEEIEYRGTLSYPPFGHVTQVIVSAVDDEQAQKAAEALAMSARSLCGQPAPQPTPEPIPAPASTQCEVLGPAPAPLPRLRDRYRYQLLVKGTDGAAVRRVSRHLAEASRRLGRDIQASVDVDPVNML